MDTTFLTLYSIGLFISGSIGDHWNPKKLLIVSYVCVSIAIAAISLCGLSTWNNPVIFCVLFGINGLMQSVGWPICVSIFANWFGKRGRGTLIGLWSSSGNFGNIVGAIMTSFFTSTLAFNWEYAYVLVGTFCFIFAILNSCLLVVHPEDKGIVIQELDDQLNETERLLEQESLLNIPESNNETQISRNDDLTRDSVRLTRGINFWKAW
jgi:sugar phosphate permease